MSGFVKRLRSLGLLRGSPKPQPPEKPPAKPRRVGGVIYVTCPLFSVDIDALDDFRDAMYRRFGERPSRQHACARLIQFALEHRNLAQEIIQEDSHAA